MDENRKMKRFHEEDNVLIKYASSSDETKERKEINARTFDISLAGARLVAPHGFETGTVLRVEIDLERTHQVLNIDAEVKWCKGRDGHKDYELGIEFLHNISNTLLSLLKHLYSENSGIPSQIV